jgi:hypothetical protein
VDNIIAGNENGILDLNPAGVYPNTISSNTITGNNTYGINSKGNANITGNTIADNGGGGSGGIRTSPGDVINFNLIYGNHAWGVYNDSSTVVDATYNWWGSNSGPTHAGNPGGTGDTVTDNVDYDPWTGQQGPTVSINAATGTGRVTFSCDAGTITGLTARDESSFPAAGKPAGVNFPHGLFSFEITNIKPGDTVTLRITLPSALPAGSGYWKYQNGTWSEIPVVSEAGTNIITIQLTDGGTGDADGVANGTIVDPGGPVAPAIARISPAGVDSPSALSSLPEHILQTGASLVVTGLNASPVQARVNQPVTIYANIINRGDAATIYSADLKINGKIEQTNTGNIGVNSAQRLQFTVCPDKPGTYNVDINGAVTSFYVSGDDGANSATNTALVIFIALVVLVITLAVVILRRRMRR